MHADADDNAEASGETELRWKARDIPITDATDISGLGPAALGVEPVALRYAAGAIDMPVFSVGVATDGQMEIPQDPYNAGWYQYGPGAGSPSGAILIAAHVGSEQVARGPFYMLQSAEVGDVIEIDDADGQIWRYEVTSVEVDPKPSIEWADYFRRDGPAQLILITCGGTWDAQRGSFDDNVIVTAQVA